MHCARAGDKSWGLWKQCHSLAMGLPGYRSALPVCQQNLSTQSNYGFTLLLLLVSIHGRILLGQGIAVAHLHVNFEPWAFTCPAWSKERSVKVPAAGNWQIGAVLMCVSIADAEWGIRAANYLSAIKENN